MLLLLLFFFILFFNFGGGGGYVCACRSASLIILGKCFYLVWNLSVVSIYSQGLLVLYLLCWVGDPLLFEGMPFKRN